MVIGCIGIVILVILLYVTYKAIKLGKAGDKRHKFMIFLLNLTMITDITRSFYLADQAAERKNNFYYYLEDYRKRMYLSEITTMLLQMTIIVNLNSWIFHIMKMR